MTAAILLTSCTQFVPKPLQPAQTAADFRARSLNDQGLQAFISDNTPGIFKDRRVTEWRPETLILAAFYYHPDLSVARARWATSRAAVMTAAQRPNPGFSISPQYNTSSSGISPWTIPVNLELPIETFGKRRARIRRAEQLSKSDALKITTAAWKVRQRVQNSLLQLQATEESAQILEAQLNVHDELIKRLQARLDAGAISPFEWVQTRTATQSLRLSLLQLKRQQREARTRLASAVGIPTSALDTIKFQYPRLDLEAAPLSLPVVQQAALTQRADILGLLARYQAAEAALRTQIARQYPNINFGPGYEFDQDDNKWGLGLSIQLPFFNQNLGPITEARAQRSAVAAEFRALQARIIGEVEQRFSAYQAQLEIASAADDLLKLSKKQEQRIRSRKEAGDLSRLDELRARVETLTAQRKALDARIEKMQTFYDLENVVQSPAVLPTSFYK